FNPALMWLSSTIREERENCCDDIAISVTNSKTKFINALIAFQEYNFSTPAYTVGFPGKKNQLLNRVKRIVNDRNKTLNATEKSLLTFGMGVFILFSFAAAKKINPVVTDSSISVKSSKAVKDKAGEKQTTVNDYRYLQKPVTPKENIVSSFEGVAYSPITPEFIDTTPKKIQSRINSGRSVFGEERAMPLHLKTYSALSDSISGLFTGISVDNKKDDQIQIEFISATKKDGTLYNFRRVNGNLTELFVNTKPVNPNDFAEYKQVINDIDNAVKYRKERATERHEMAAADREARMLDKQTRLDENRLRLSEQRLLEREQRKLAEDHKRDLLNHDRATRDSQFHRKQNELLLNKTKMRITNQAKSDMRVNVKPRVGDDMRMKVEPRVKMDVRKNIEPNMKMDVKMKIDTSTMLRVKKGDRYVEYDDLKKLDLKLKTDSFVKGDKKGYAEYADVVKYSDLERDEARLRKQEAMRMRASEDDIRVQQSAEIMRNIITDLEADGIKINMQTSWFALDKEQFIVDGNKISAELHEKFRNKYIKPKDGWGYYYGPIKVTGRGIFLDYKNLVK
ncbi:MAG: hypothetical protein ABI581_07170, partial [Sediminibacterium sp.]